jgi:hypothetical protein
MSKFINYSLSEIVPNEEFVKKLVNGTKVKSNKEYDFENYMKTSKRTVFTISVDRSTSEDDLINFYQARNVFMKYQYKFPMKYLQASPNNQYVSQKTILSEYSQNIESAAKQIEPFNIGFDHYIQLIPINQDLEIGTTFTIEIHNPYESNERKFFRSKSLKTIDSELIPFNHNIHIGTIDIGSKYTGKFVVTDLRKNLSKLTQEEESKELSNNFELSQITSDVLNKFNFSCDKYSFSLIWYDYIFNFKKPEDVFKQLLDESRMFSDKAYEMFKNIC